MPQILDPPARVSSWVTRSFTAGLCVAASGLAAYWVLQRSTEPARLSATEEPTPFRLPPLTDQHPRPPDSTAPASRIEGLAPLSAITRNDVLKVVGMDRFADAGVGEPPERPALGVRAARADAGPSLPPPPIIEPPAEPPAEPQPPEAPPPEGQALEARAAEAQAPEAQPPQVAAAGEVCGFTTCEVGFGCCNASCGVCVAPGDNCDPTQCENKTGENEIGESKIENPSSVTCGRATCSEGQVCCNPSCGTCVNPSESCDSTPCDSPIQYPFSAICGRRTCSVGQECCNPSCGICVAPGDSCRQELCP